MLQYIKEIISKYGEPALFIAKTPLTTCRPLDENQNNSTKKTTGELLD
jgi:hypothetical protein